MKNNHLLFLKRVFKHQIIIGATMLLIPAAIVQAATITTAGSGNWNSTTVNAPWPGGTVPLSTDDVIIATGHTIDLTAVATIKNLTIQTGAILNVGGFNYTVTGTTSLSGTINHTSTTGVKTFTGLVTINAGGVWNNSANEDINFRGGLTYSGSTFSAGTGIYTFTINHQVITGTLTIPKVTVNLKSLTNNGTLTVSTNLAGTGNLINSATGTLVIGGVSGIDTLTATATGNTVNYTGGAQNVHNGNYCNLGLSGTGKKTLQTGTTTISGNLVMNGTSANATTVADLAITGNLHIGDGNTFTAAAFALTVGGTTTVGGGTSGTLTISSSTGAKLFTGLVTIATGATWNNSGNSPVEFRGGINTTPTFTGGGGVHTFSTNAQSLVGTFSIPNVTATGITLTNNGTLTVSTALEGTGGLTNAATGTLNINGTSGITTLTATATGNTVNYTNNLQTVHDGNYYNLILSGGFKKTLQAGTSLIGGNLTLTGTSANTTTVADLTINGNLVIGDGNAFTADGFALTVEGTTEVGTGTGGNLFLTGSSGTKLFKGHVTLGAGAKWIDYGDSPVEFRNGITNNGVSFSAGNGVYSFTTNNQAVGGTDNISIPNLKVDGVTLTNNLASLTAGASLEGSGGVTNSAGNTLKINGTSTITTITATASNNIVAYFGDNQAVHNGSYNHLAIGGTGVKTISTADVTIINTFAIRTMATVSAPPTFGPAASLRYNTPETRTTGVEWITPFTSTGGVAIFNTGTITLNEDKVLNAGVPLSVTDATATLDADSVTLTLGGGFNNNGTFTPGTGTVIFNGATAQAVTGTSNTPFHHLTIDNVSGVSTGNGETSVGGNFTNNGTFSPGAGTIALNGTSDQSITGTSATTFNNLSVNKTSGGVLLGNHENVNGTLTLTQGIIDGATYTLTIGPSGSLAGGSSSSYVSGQLALTYTGTGTKGFPIGKGGAYRPVTLQLTGLTGTSVINAEQFESALTGNLPENSTLLTTTRHWTLGQSGGSNLQYFITLDATDYTPSRPVLILKKDTGTIVSCATTTPNYTNSTALTGFSEFGLGEACINPDDGGTIQSDLSGCPNFIPDEITGTIPTGQTGTLEYQWQSSTTSDTSGFSDINGATDVNYTPGAISNTTWFRRLVKVDCTINWTGCEISNAVKITILPDCKISGIVNYENNPKTPLNGLKVVLKQGTTAIDSVNTDASGHYAFVGLSIGTYSLTVKPAHPSGQWQTWGGVTNSDYLLVAQHIAGSSLLQVDPPVVRVSASVKVPHPVINSLDATAIRQAAKYPLTGWSYFDIPKWVFSGTSGTSRMDSVVVSRGNVTRDIRGLCAGDVNGTYVPGNGYKVAGSGLEMATMGTIPVTDEMAFAVGLIETQGFPQPIGAITLFMNYDPTLVEITNVTMPMNGGTEPWFETDNGVLYIGWISTESISVVENQTVLLVHARLVTKSTPIRFTLNETMVSELADGDGNAIDGAKLAMPGAGSNGETGKWQNGETAKRQNGKIVCYPNPVQSTLNIELFTSNLQPSTCNLELVNLHGIPLLNLQPATFNNGWHKVQLDVRDLMPGAYCLRAWVNGELFVKKVIITR